MSNDDLAAELDAALARASEIVRREFAQKYKGDPRVWGDAGAAPVRPRRLDAVQSVRMDADLAAAVRGRAEMIGESTSDLLRRAAERVALPVGFACQHVSMTSAAGVIQSVRATCGCDMQPIYA